MGLPRWCSSKECTCQCRKCGRRQFGPWVWKIPWRKTWQPTPVFSPGEFHGQRSPVGCSPWGCKESTEHICYRYNIVLLFFHFTKTVKTLSWKNNRIWETPLAHTCMPATFPSHNPQHALFQFPVCSSLLLPSPGTLPPLLTLIHFLNPMEHWFHCGPVPIFLPLTSISAQFSPLNYVPDALITLHFQGFPALLSRRNQSTSLNSRRLKNLTRSRPGAAPASPGPSGFSHF